MTPLEIITQAEEEGVQLSLSDAGKLRTAGIRVSVEKWLPVIREHKAEIIEHLKAQLPREDLARAVKTACLLVGLVPEAEAKITAALDDLLKVELANDAQGIDRAVFSLERLCLRVWAYFESKQERSKAA